METEATGVVTSAAARKEGEKKAKLDERTEEKRTEKKICETRIETCMTR